MAQSQGDSRKTRPRSWRGRHSPRCKINSDYISLRNARPSLSNGEIQFRDAPDDHLRAPPDARRNPALYDACRASEAGPARNGASVNAERSQQIAFARHQRERAIGAVAEAPNEAGREQLGWTWKAGNGLRRCPNSDSEVCASWRTAAYSRFRRSVAGRSTPARSASTGPDRPRVRASSPARAGRSISAAGRPRARRLNGRSHQAVARSADRRARAAAKVCRCSIMPSALAGLMNSLCRTSILTTLMSSNSRSQPR